MAPSSLVREKALLEVIRQGFLVSSRSQTHAMLGDRTSYVGMSDVGKYLESVSYTHLTLPTIA